MVSKYSACSILVFFYILFFSCGFILARGIPADNNDQDSIILKKEELSRVKKEINSLELELNAKTKKEKKASSLFENISRQGFLLNKLINKLLKEEGKKQSRVEEIQLNINSLEKEIKSVQDNYSKYITAIYKSGKNSEWAELFNSNSFRQALLRYKYLNEFSERRQKDLEELKGKKQELKEEKIILNKEVKEKELLTIQKLKEKEILGKKIKERKKILNTIKHDRKSLSSELKLKKNSEAKIKEIINLLVEQARRNKELLAEISSNPGSTSPGPETVEGKINEPVYSAGFPAFADLKGKMNWPVSNGKIINRFGENRNKALNTITLNYGIDIQPGSGNSVNAVAPGVVSAVEWIPGYGSVIIITHSGEFRTVFGHLSDIFVEEGDRVNAGQIIGTVAEDLEGRILHFEIWNSRINQDPEIWLAGK